MPVTMQNAPIIMDACMGQVESMSMAESGVMVARCLTNVPGYSQRFSNPQDRAKRILQNLAANQNHAVAKHMLKQIK